MRLEIERWGLGSASSSCTLRTSSHASTAPFESFASRVLAFSFSFSSFDMESQTYPRRRAGTSRTPCPHVGYEVRSHPIRRLAPVAHGECHQVGAESRRVLAPLGRQAHGCRRVRGERQHS